MNVITNAFRHVKHVGGKTIILRLCKNKHYGLYTGHISRTLFSLQRCSVKYEYPFPHRSCTSVALKEKIVPPEVGDMDNYSSESETMHMILENSVHYASTIIPNIIVKLDVSDLEIEELLNNDWSSSTALDIYSAIKKIAYNHSDNSVSINSKKYTNIIEALSNKLPELSNDQLKNLFKYLKPLRKEYNKCKAYESLLKMLDKQCLHRFMASNTGELLLICDGFYQIGRIKSDFVWRAIRKIGNKTYKLPPQFLVHYAFLLGEYRKPPVNMYEVEYRFGECINDLSLNEIGVVARGFFKTKTRIRSSQLVNLIIQRVTNAIKTVDNINLAAIMKLIRYSVKLEETSVFRILLSALVPELPQLSLMCLTHVAHAAANSLIYDKNLMQVIIERLKTDVSIARLKDIERIAYAVCTVCPESDENNIFDVITQELLATCTTSRAHEIDTYPNALTRILEKLSCKNIYPEELLKIAFNPKRVTSLVQRKLFTDELWILHNNILIDQPSYSGPLLSDAVVRFSIKKFNMLSNYEAVKHNKTALLIKEILFRCKKLLPIDMCVAQILPSHTSMDIIFGFDENDNSVPVESILLSKMSPGSIIRVDTDEMKKIKWKALVIITIGQVVKGTNEYISTTKTKLRHLRKIGYTPIEIIQSEWNAYETEEEKNNFLLKKING